MNIMISVSDLSMGGAQIFAVRLAIAFSEDNQVCIYNHQILQKHKESSLVKQLPWKVKVIYFPPKLDFLVSKIDRLLSKASSSHRIGHVVRSFFFKAVVNIYKIDIVNSHLYPSDNFISNALKNHSVPIVMTDHGEYRYVIEQGFSSFSEVKKIVNRVNGIVYCSHSNAKLFSKYLEGASCLEKTIYNGLPEKENLNFSVPARTKLRISESSFVFGMVARGIPEKGWNELIKAFQYILHTTNREMHLILVGESCYLTSLKESLNSSTTPYIHFVGYSSEPDYWIEAFDVALLPTHFSGESLPNSIVEYLCLSKPVIATNLGGISEMITYDKELSGVLIDLDECGQFDIEALAEAMLNYLHNLVLLDKHTRLAKQAFEKFKMQTCVDSYSAFFREVIETNRV